VSFLRTHSSTLVDLHLQLIGFPDGNWNEPLNVIKSMPKIQHLYLNMLLEIEAYDSTEDASQTSGEPQWNAIHLSTSTAIASALETVCRDIRSIPTEYEVSDFDGQAYSWQVDLRQARAAGLTKIMDEEGN